ncbi:hypothetical protein [Litoribacillus peritrichatus]|uniref:Uncharacterized protein n=1 Tax=Litoribacillus peritrichatus TaxID=718191 RepID=A0ABP7M5Z1_9GAMM
MYKLRYVLFFSYLTFTIGSHADNCVPYNCAEENPSHCSMTIYAPKGHKVKITEATAKNGSAWQQEKIAELLDIGKIYTVERTIVDRSSTAVILSEVKDIRFNSVNFVDVCVLPENIKESHPDWIRYNAKK